MRNYSPPFPKEGQGWFVSLAQLLPSFSKGGAGVVCKQ